MHVAGVMPGFPPQCWRWPDVRDRRAGGTRCAVPAEPFKVANIHFETNASACDMGIQIIFDTDGITEGSVKAPNGRRIYSFAPGRYEGTGGQTEGFLEGIEPQITELLSALGCEPSDEEEEISLDDLFEAFPAGDYTFKGTTQGRKVRRSSDADARHSRRPGNHGADRRNRGPRRGASHRLGAR